MKNFLIIDFNLIEFGELLKNLAQKVNIVILQRIFGIRFHFAHRTRASLWNEVVNSQNNHT